MKFLPLILIILFIYSSCIKEFEIDLPEIEVKPVVNCIFSPKCPFSVNLSLPALPTDTDFVSITDAEVSISGDNGTNFKLQHKGGGNYSNSLAIPEPGVFYNLKVEVDGYHVVTANDKIPESATKVTDYLTEIRNDSDPINGPSEGGVNTYYNLKLTLYNDLNIEDYMGISVVHNRIAHHYRNDSVYLEVESGKYVQGYIGSSDLVIASEGLENYDNASLLLFKDKLFSNESESVNIKVYIELAHKFWLKFYLYSPTCFTYFRTWIIHDYTKSYDFWEVYEPLPLYSNIENGYGIFAGYSSKLYEIYPDSIQTFNKWPGN